MRLGTIDVRANLPEGTGHITEKQIHDALWHYYYDVEKTVGYLIATYVAKPKKPQKKATSGKKETGRFCLSFGISTMDCEQQVRAELDWVGGGFIFVLDHGLALGAIPLTETYRKYYIKYLFDAILVYRFLQGFSMAQYTPRTKGYLYCTIIPQRRIARWIFIGWSS